MSFPGHAKSIQISQEPPTVFRRNSSDTYKELWEHERRVSAESGDPRKRIGHGSGRPPIVSSPADDGIVDDKGNKPTRSLWVGNTYHGMRNSQLYEKFGVFGPIESAITKPMTRYSFVNFVNVEDAISAWRSFNGVAVFQDDKPLHVRFTVPETEAKQVKEDNSERKSSANKKYRAAGLERLRAIGDEKNKLPNNNDADENVWPNGPPPSAPKSHRKDISPPPLRRGGDSYRPSDRPVHLAEYDTYKPGLEGRDVKRDTRRKGRDMYRPNHSRRSRSRSRSTSRSSSDRGSYCSSLYGSPRPRRTSSPVPWERNTKIGDSNSTAVNPEFQQAKQRAQMIAANLLSLQGNARNNSLTHLSTPLLMMSREKSNEDIRAESTARPQSNGSYSPMSHVSYQDHIPEESSEGKTSHSQTLTNSLISAPSVSPSRNAFAQDAAKSVSSSVPLSKRLRIEREETCSIISEMTSSTKSSLRKKKCADCKKLGSDLSPLVACCTCPRRFHSGCGDPRPSSCPVKTIFKCGRCIQEMRPDSSVVAAPAELGKSHLASPPLSLSNNDSNDALSLSREVTLSVDTTTSSNNPLLFQADTPQTPAALSSTTVKSKRGVLDDELIRFTDGAVDAKDYVTDVLGDMSTGQSQQDFEQTTLLNMQKYKGVTCHYWWTRGQCWLAEEQCLYAHRDTGIQRPDDRRPSKAWTCWKWLNEHICPHPERDCVYAHKDTGLHMTFDGRASLKHITCVWWIRSNACKWSGAACRFAHEDTGVYALEPGDKRFRGSAISSIRPVPLWRVPTSEQSNRPSKRTKDTTDFENSVSATDAENAESFFKMQFDDQIPIYARPQRRVSLMSSGTRDGMQEFGATTGRQLSVGPLNPKGSHMTEGLYGSSFSQSIPNAGSATELSSSETPILVEGRDIQKLDPRKRKQTAPTTCSTSVNQPANISSVSLHPLGDNIALENLIHGSSAAFQGNTNIVNLQAPANSKTKKCNVCSKIVFNDVLCRGCKEPKLSLDQVSPTSISQSSVVFNASPTEEARPVKSKPPNKIADFVLDDFESGHPEKPKSMTKPTIKLSIKRSTSGENMFIPNKRPKLSMAFSHTGSLRPGGNASLRNLRIGEKPPVKTLDQLAREARIQNGRAPDELTFLPAAITTSATGNDADRAASHHNATGSLIETGIDTRENHVLSDVPKPCPERLEPQADAGNNYSVPVAESDEVSVSSDIDLLVIPYSTPAEPSHLNYGREEVEQQKHQFGNTNTSPGVSKKNARPVIRACQECNEKHRKCTHGSFGKVPGIAPRIQKTKESQVDREKKKASEDVIISPLKVSTEETIQYVCVTCRRHHKKCLHNEFGLFDPSRCAIYIKHRVSRPSCYSSAEWERIVRAAKALEQPSESSSSDGSDDIEWKDSFSPHGYIDLSLPHSDGEEVASEVATGTIHTVPTESRQELSVFEAAIPVSINVPSKKVRARRERDDPWTFDDHKKHNDGLKIQGAMFESESESDDYASDDDRVHGQARLHIDPLCVPQKLSYDLYKVCPELRPNHLIKQSSSQPLGYRKKVSRKEEWKNLRTTQRRTRLEIFGNPHREVDRMKPDTMITAMVEQVTLGVKDALVPEVQTRHEKISFRDFLGLPKRPLACLMDDRATLAYRDAIKDNDYMYLATSTRGFGRLATEEDRLPVYDK